IAIDLAALTQTPQLTLLDGKTYATARTGLERRGAGDFTWRGKVLAPDGLAGTATLTVQGGQMAGRIVVPGGDAYEVAPAPDGGPPPPPGPPPAGRARRRPPPSRRVRHGRAPRGCACATTRPCPPGSTSWSSTTPRPWPAPAAPARCGW